jgi:hypothetical protein
MTDQITISQLRDWPPGKVASLPIEVLAALAASLAEMKTFVADAEARLNAGLDVRFGDRARQLRAADGKDTLLRAEQLDTLPKFLAEQVKQRGGG